MLRVICAILEVDIQLPDGVPIEREAMRAFDVNQYGAELHRRIYQAAGERWLEVAALAAIAVKQSVDWQRKTALGPSMPTNGRW